MFPTIKSKTDFRINPNSLTIEETKKILNIMENTVFEVNVNNKQKMKGLLLKTPLEKNVFAKILILFYEGKKEMINFIKIEKKSLNINAKIKIDDSRKILNFQYLAFIEIKSNDKIKDNAFLSVEEKINKNSIQKIKKNYINKLYYTDKVYFSLDNQEDDSFTDIPNNIPIKGSLLKIYLTPESHKIISIFFYLSDNSLYFANNEFIIDKTKKLISQKTKINARFFNFPFFKSKPDLSDQITKISTDSEESETQLDFSRPSKENDENTELNSFFENRGDSIKILLKLIG